MYAVVGTLFLAIAGGLAAWTRWQCRRPNPRPWTERDLPALAITLAVLTLLWSGVAFFGRFVADISDQPFGLAEAGLIAIFAAVFVVSLALFRASRRVLRRRRGRVPATGARRLSGSPGLRPVLDLRPRRGAQPSPSRPAARGTASVRRNAA
jgi:amino acid transporter